ncbi:GIY-YIG nuclease family protein [Pseudomonas aeruginosa]|uniref:GIY-YIG nuclease family protein n=1 Tax=Pseudomonas aeruginosa TaxID=287 RepID=UPI0010672098|nr:GIY-YIG nuclease family protein [Pseudomonas aeruginosa]TED04537.1 GIY-YIG nuclease family protein [Pseudomonas aeruginosa]
MSNSDLDDLAAELAEFAPPEKKNGRPASEERVIAGFEEIQRFAEQHGRAPQHGEDRDIFERLYAVRLDRLRALPDCRALLEPLDHQGLLAGAPTVAGSAEETIDIDDLAAELADVADTNDITVLRHVRTSAEKRAAEEIEHREKCEDFDRYEHLFKAIKQDLKSGVRNTRSFLSQAKAMEAIQQGAYYILNGQIAYIAEVGEDFTTQYDRRDSRLRVIFDNGTESKILLRSFQRALHRDEAARVIADPDAGPLFNDSLEEGDIQSGTIYVLRSLSDHPYIAQHRDLIHKLGVTGGRVEARIANAEHDSTYLLAKVEVVATYKLAGINRTRMEKLFHRLFAPARLNISINDRFGRPVQPEEWFLVPLFVIDEAVARIKDGSITGYVYDPKAAKLVKAAEVGGV